MNLNDIRPRINQFRSEPPASSIGVSGDKKGDFCLDAYGILHFCFEDYSNSTASVTIVVDNQTSAGSLRKESGISDADFVSLAGLSNPTAGNWVFSFPTVSQATIQNIPVQGITFGRVNGLYSARQITIGFDQNLVNNLSGFNSNYNLLWDKPCVLTGRNTIWRKIVISTAFAGQF